MPAEFCHILCVQRVGRLGAEVTNKFQHRTDTIIGSNYWLCNVCSKLSSENNPTGVFSLVRSTDCVIQHWPPNNNHQSGSGVYVKLGQFRLISPQFYKKWSCVNFFEPPAPTKSQNVRAVRFLQQYQLFYRLQELINLTLRKLPLDQRKLTIALNLVGVDSTVVVQ